jgi:hypothetical protein
MSVTSGAEVDLPLRIVLLAPPAGVRFALQKGASTAKSHPELVEAQTADGAGNLTFNLTVRARAESDSPPRLLGPFVQGPPSQRFVYITVGESAGQVGSPWKRRAKIPLAGITAALAKAVVQRRGAWLEAAVPGTLKDGSPTCATQPFAPNGDWQLRA